MYSLEWLTGSIAIAAIIGGSIGYWISASSSTKKQALKLEEDLAETRLAYEAYRNEVYEEFSETAAKFKSLNESYIDLHRHLAKSASNLCGETAASSLLEAPGVQTNLREIVENAIDTEPDETIEDHPGENMGEAQDENDNITIPEPELSESKQPETDDHNSIQVDFDPNTHVDPVHEPETKAM